MKLITISLILAVPVLNILLNISIRNTAINSSTYIGALISFGFFVSFFIGLASILSMLGLYSTGINLSRAIIIMGAISILVGSMFGVIWYNENLHTVEWLLFLLIFSMLLYRFIYKT